MNPFSIVLLIASFIIVWYGLSWLYSRYCKNDYSAELQHATELDTEDLQFRQYLDSQSTDSKIELTYGNDEFNTNWTSDELEKLKAVVNSSEQAADTEQSGDNINNKEKKKKRKKDVKTTEITQDNNNNKDNDDNNEIDNDNNDDGDDQE